MGEAIAKLVAALFVIVAVIYIIVLLVIAAVIIAAVLAPPVAAGYWLRSLLTRRYQLGPRKTMKCALVGIAMAALPWVSLAVSSTSASEWATASALWMSITGALLGIGLYLSLSVYREVFWPHRKAMIAATKESLKLRQQLFQDNFRLNRVESKVRKFERREGVRLTEIRQLEQSISEIVLATDPAFLSAERVRWEREYGSLDDASLRRELQSVQGEMNNTDRSSPYFASLVVQAGVITLSAHKRAIESGAGASYESDAREQERLRSVTDDLRQRITALQQQSSDARSSLRQLRRQRLFVQ